MSKFQNYIQLLEKVDKQFDKIHTQYKSEMQCGKSCHSCCKPGIRVNNLEKEYIRSFLLNNPSILDHIRKNKMSNIYESERCEFLNEKGECNVYDARPIVCRSHGAPLWFKISEEETLDEDGFPESVFGQDVCPLNFKETDLLNLDPDSFINMDTVNSILTLINRMFEKEEILKENSRHELSLSGLGIRTENIQS